MNNGQEKHNSYDLIADKVARFRSKIDLTSDASDANLEVNLKVSKFIENQSKKLLQVLSLGESWLGDLALDECFEDLADNIEEIDSKNKMNLDDPFLSGEDILARKGIDLTEFYLNEDNRKSYLAEMSSLLTIDENKKENAYKRLLQEYNVQKIADITRRDFESLFADNYRELFLELSKKAIPDRQISDLILIKTFLHEQAVMANDILKTVFKYINSEEDNFKSSNFDLIHQPNEVANLVILRNQLQKNQITIEEMMDKNFKKETSIVFDNELLEDKLIDCKKSIFEINRLFYLMEKAHKLYKVSPFLDQHQKEISFKIANMFTTENKALNWGTDENGKYVWAVGKTIEADCHLFVCRKPIKVNSWKINGYLNSTANLSRNEKEKKTINILDYSFRAKTRESEMIKGTLGREINDKWWLKIIVEKVDQETINTIRKILQTEFNNKNWYEKLEYCANGSVNNTCSSSDFKSYKGILELPIPCNCDESVKNIDNKTREIDRILNVLKNNYYYPLEVQIMDIESYIKNDLDIDSASFHGRYKEDQIIRKLFTTLFPEEIYAEKGLGDYLKYSERSWIVFHHSFKKTAKRKFNSVLEKMENLNKKNSVILNNKDFIGFVMNKIFEVAIREFHLNK